MTCVMAPFTPFLSELMYQNLRHLVSSPQECVHFVMMPEPQLTFIDNEIERSVNNMQTVIELGRVIRDKHSQPMKVIIPFYEQKVFRLEYLIAVERNRMDFKMNANAWIP